MAGRHRPHASRVRSPDKEAAAALCRIIPCDSRNCLPASRQRRSSAATRCPFSPIHDGNILKPYPIITFGRRTDAPNLTYSVETGELGERCRTSFRHAGPRAQRGAGGLSRSVAVVWKWTDHSYLS
jgi:hypothetical protein